MIARRRPGTPMPAFRSGQGGPLTDAQVKALAAGIKPNGSSRRRTARRSRTCRLTWPADAATTGEHRQRAAQSFSPRPAPAATGHGEGRAAMAGAAINDPAFLALISDQALRRLIITGRPDLGMPDFAGNDGRAGRLPAADVAPRSTIWSRCWPLAAGRTGRTRHDGSGEPSEPWSER